MSERSDFLRCFTPVPEGAALPERISSAYDAESCLRRREDGGWTLRLRRRADGALYVLKADPAGNEDLPGEFQILTRLSPLLSGAVPEPAACFQEDGTTYLLRAFLPGETLRQYRERVGVCPEETCVRLGQKLCALLETLHGQEPPVIHRDIKPENIILLPDGGVGLIDFGIARLYKADQDTDTRRMGTRSTAAPEQYGYAQTDQRTDLYALGMTLIWLATGTYEREALAQATDLSPYFRQTLEKAVSFAPEDRYQSAGDFSTALAGKAPPPRRRRWPVLAASLLLAVLAGVFWPGNGAPASGGDAEVPAEAALPQEVEFTSSSLESAVRAALDQPEGPITYDQLAEIRHLGIVGQTAFGPEQVFEYRISCYVDGAYMDGSETGDISDLSLLAYMPNLEELYLCCQEIKDISPLAELPLTVLALCENKILDLSPLAELTELETLYLGGNPATDYSALAGLTRLETLVVEGSATAGINAAEDLAFLDGLTLRQLGLGLTVPKDGDWSPLTRQIALEELLLWDPGEGAVAAANTLSDLRILTIGDYYAPDLTGLTGLAGLEVLNIHKGGMESLEGIQSLTRLYTLSVGFNAVTDLEPLAGLPQLNYVQLEELAITDFSPLAQLPALEYVVVPQAQGAAVEAACPGHAFELRTY